MYDLLCSYFDPDAVNLCFFLLLIAPLAGWKIASAIRGNGVTCFRRRLRRNWLAIGGSVGLLFCVIMGYTAQKDSQQQAIIELFSPVTEALASLGESFSNLRNYLTPEEKKSRLLPVGLATNATAWVAESQCVTSQVREAWQRVPIRRAAFRQTLPFPVSVGDHSYDEVFISSSGVIGFDAPKGSELTRGMPYEEAADHVYLALLWGRIDFKPRLGSKMWCGVKEDGNFVASYDTVFIDGDTNAVAKVQVEFIANGDMILRYSDLPLCATNSHVAGFQNLDGGWTLPFDNIRSNTALYLKSFGPLDLTVQDSDTDGDGISDYYELYPTNSASITDPCNPDTDHDGLNDGWEVRQGFDPAASGGTWEDPDSDGRPNVMESYMDTDPFVADGTPDCLTADEDKASVTFTLAGSLSDDAFAVLWFDGTALPFSVSNTSWTVHFPTNALYEARFDAPEAYASGLAVSNANRMLLVDPSGVISSTTPPVSGSHSGTFWMGYVDFSVTPLSSLVHRWDAHILFTAEPDSALSPLSSGAFINWTATYGEVSSPTGWVSVFSPYFQEDGDASVNVADVVAYSGSSEFPDTYVSSTGKVDICNGHIDLSLNATPNFSPHLGETNTVVIAAAMHNCNHYVTPGEGCTFEIELMRETNNGWQHVAWLDADPGTAGKQNAFTITNGWQETTLLWDGIATENAAQTTSPDVFTQGTQPFNRVFHSVTSGKPLPPPFYTIFTRIKKNDTIYAQASQTVFVPQVVKIEWDEDVVALLASPDYYPEPPEPPEVTIYHGTNTESIVEMLQALPELVSSAYPTGVNVRFTTKSTATDSAKVVSIKRKDALNKALGFGVSYSGRANFPNNRPSGTAEIFTGRMREEIRISCSNYIGLTNAAQYISSIPVQSIQYINCIANTIVHEVGHEFGLLMPMYLNRKKSDMHNTEKNPLAIMNQTASTLHYIQEPSEFYWLSVETQYLEFILPTP
jgi:hypothetical protein